MTPRKIDKGKKVVEHTPSSSRARSAKKYIPRWFRKEIMRSAKPQFYVSEDDICDIAEILNKPKSPLHEVVPFAFVTTIRNQDLFAQVALPHEGKDAEGLSLEDYELKDVMLGRPIWESKRSSSTWSKRRPNYTHFEGRSRS